MQNLKKKLEVITYICNHLRIFTCLNICQIFMRCWQSFVVKTAFNIGKNIVSLIWSTTYTSILVSVPGTTSYVQPICSRERLSVMTAPPKGGTVNLHCKKNLQ